MPQWLGTQQKQTRVPLSLNDQSRFMIWQIKGFSVSSPSIACKQDIWYQTPLQFHIFKQYNDQAPFSCYDLELKEEAISRAKKLEHYKKSQNNMPSLIPCLISVNNIIPMTLRLLCLVKQKSSWASTTFRRVMATFSLQLCCALMGLAHSNLCPFCNSKHTAAQCYCPAYAAWNCQPISSSKQATDMYRGQGPNNQGPTSWHWRHKPLDVAGPKVLIVPTITYFSSERAPLEISSSIVNGLMFGASLYRLCRSRPQYSQIYLLHLWNLKLPKNYQRNFIQ